MKGTVGFAWFAIVAEPYLEFEFDFLRHRPVGERLTIADLGEKTRVFAADSETDHWHFLDIGLATKSVLKSAAFSGPWYFA